MPMEPEQNQDAQQNKPYDRSSDEVKRILNDPNVKRTVGALRVFKHRLVKRISLAIATFFAAFVYYFIGNAWMILVFAGVLTVALWTVSILLYLHFSSPPVAAPAVDSGGVQQVSGDAGYRQAFAQLFAPRELTEAQKIKLIPLIQKIGTQKFVVVQIGFGDNEAGNYAQQIAYFLRGDCGWSGSAYLGLAPSDQLIQIHSGVAVQMGPEDLMEMHKSGQWWDVPKQLGDAFADAGMEMATGGIIMSLKLEVPCPKGTVLIIVGAKPRPEDSAPNPLNYKPSP